jgi:multidrug resistance efflux pump
MRVREFCLKRSLKAFHVKPRSIGNAKSERASAQDALAFQQHELERKQRLLGSGIASQLRVDRVSHARDEAATQVADAQQQKAARTIQRLDKARFNLHTLRIAAPSMTIADERGHSSIFFQLVSWL